MLGMGVRTEDWIRMYILEFDDVNHLRCDAGAQPSTPEYSEKQFATYVDLESITTDLSTFPDCQFFNVTVRLANLMPRSMFVGPSQVVYHNRA